MAIYDVLKNQVTSSKQSLFNDACLAVAAFICQFTTYENDLAIRELMDELTPDEARAVVVADIANAEWHRLAEEFWSSG